MPLSGRTKIQLVRCKASNFDSIILPVIKILFKLGPFRADLMQKWYEEGYFTPDLPMKRTHIDTHWTMMQDLVDQATSGNLFLTPSLSTGPPGLDRNSPAHINNEPLQPPLMRSLRNSSFESYIAGGSIASESPTSSFGASHFGNSSPDPSTIGGNDRVHANNDLNGRMTVFGLYDHPASAYTGHRLSGHDLNFEQVRKLHGSPFGSLVSGMDANLNGHALDNLRTTRDTWAASSNHQVSALDIPSTLPSSHLDNSHHGLLQDPSGRYNGGGLPNHANLRSQHSEPIESNTIMYTTGYDMAGGTTFTYTPVQQPFSYQIPDFGQHPNQSFTLCSSEPSVPQMSYSSVSNAPSSLAQSPWTVIPNTILNNDIRAMEAPQPITSHVSGFINLSGYL